LILPHLAEDHSFSVCQGGQDINLPL
jgi:hypothetical protein